MPNAVRRAVRHYVPRPWRRGAHRRRRHMIGWRWSKDTLGMLALGTVSVAVVAVALAATPQRALPATRPAPEPGVSTSTMAQRAERDRALVPAFTREDTVRQGDTLWTIAYRAYGNGAAWPYVGWFNHKSATSVLQPGERIKLP